MKIVFLAVDDEFAGAMQKYVYEKHPEWVIGSVISTCPIYKKSKMGAVLFIIKQSGFLYFAEMVRMKLLRKKFGKKKHVTPSLLAKQHNVEIFYCKNINDEQSLSQIRKWKPDLIISTNFSHYVGKMAREIVPVGAWNLHKSFLPNFRGMAPNFYVLLESGKMAGVTLHKIARGFDTGDIITQTEIPVRHNDTVYSLNKRTSDEGGRMLAKFLEAVDLSNIATTPQSEGEWGYYTYPNRKQIIEFRKKGLRF